MGVFPQRWTDSDRREILGKGAGKRCEDLEGRG